MSKAYLIKAFFILILLFINSSVFGITKYLRPTGGNYNVNNNWSTASNTTLGTNDTTFPVAGDDVILDGFSGNLTINTTSACRSFDTTGYAGTITHNPYGLAIGDATAGTGNVALKLVVGMTYTLSPANNATSAFSFVSTSATVQTIDWGGKTTGNVTFNGAGGSWRYLSTHAFTTTATVTHLQGTLDTNGQSLSGAKFASTSVLARTLSLGASVLNLSGLTDAYFDCTNVTNLTVTANTAIVNINRSVTSNAPLFISGVKNWLGLSIVWNGGGQAKLTGGVGSTYHNLTVNGAPIQSATDDRFVLTDNITITGILTLNGLASSRRLRFNSVGTSSTLTVPNATSVTGQYFDFLNINLTIQTDLSGILGGSGNIDGNSGVTFTPSITCYWQTTTAGTKQWNDSVNWFLATNGVGAGRVPLPQDNVRFDANSIGAVGTIINCSVDMKRLGSDIDFTGVLNNPQWNFEQTEYCHGSLTLDPNMTMSVSADVFFNMAGRGSGQFFTLKTCGVLIPHSIFAIEIGSTTTVTMLDDFNGNVLNTTEFNLTGIVNLNNKNVTAGKFKQQSGTVTMGSGIYTITGTGNVWSCVGTFNANTSSIIINNTSVTAKTFNGQNKTFNNVTFSGDNITVSGNNSFLGNFRVQNAGLPNGLILTSGSTQTITTFTTNGFVGNLAILKSTIAASFATITKVSGIVSVDYMSIKDSRAATTGTAVWYAGANSTNVSGNTVWIFTPSAIRYWVGGNISNDWDATFPTNWSETSGGAGDATIPTGNDNVFFDALSGNAKIDANIAIRSIDCTGYIGTLTHAAGVKLSIGNAFAWGSNIGLKFVDGMNYVLNDAVTSEIEFVSTTTTVQSVDFASKTTGNVTYNGALGSWRLAGTHNTGSTATVTLTRGTLDTNGQICSWGLFNTNNANTRVLTLGASIITLTGIGNVWDMTDTTNLTFNANTSTIIINNTSVAAKTFIGGNKTYHNIIFSGDNITVTGSNFFYEMRVQNAGLPTGLILTAGTTQTVTSFTTNGFASNLAIIKSSLGGTPAVITKASGSVSVDYMSIQDITAATTGTAVWYAGANSLNVSGNGGGVPWLFINQPKRYWVGGGSSNTWSAVGPSNWSTTSGVIENASVPTTSDNVFFDSNSGTGNSEISANISIRSLNTTGYSGTIMHNSAVTISIGDENPGENNIALKFGSGMTYTLNNLATSALQFISTSATTQTIEWGGITTGNVTFNATTNGVWKYLSTHNFSTSATLNLTKGTLDTNSNTLNGAKFLSNNANARTLTLGNSIVNLTGIGFLIFDCGTVTNLTVTPNTATVNLYRTQSFTVFFTTGSKNWGFNLNYYGGGKASIQSGSAGSTFNNITVNGAPNSNNVEDVFQIRDTVFITGSITFNGYSASRRMKVYLDAGKSITVPNSTSVSGQYVDFYDFNLSTANDLSGIVGGSGDAKSNSNITFTPGITCYWKTTTGGVKQWNEVSNWYLGTNGTGGQARIPLPQDNVVFDSNSIGAVGTTVNVSTDVLRVGNNIDWTGVLNNPNWHFEPINDTAAIPLGSHVSNFGSLTLDPNMTMSSAKPNASFYMVGRGNSQAFTLKTCGVQIPHEEFGIYLAPTNTLTFLDDFNGNALNTTLLKVTCNFNFHAGDVVGTVDFNNKNVSTGRFQQESLGSIIMGSGLFKMKGTGVVWSSAGTVNSNTSTIEISDGSASAKTFTGGGKVYNNLTLSGNGNASYTFSGNNTFNNFTDSKTVAHTLLFFPGSNTTFTSLGAVSIAGSAGNYVTLASSTTAIFTWTRPGGTINCDYLILSKSTATGGGQFNAGSNSINGGGNTNWNFLSIHPFIWKGTFSNQWTDVGNWQGGVVPSTTDIAYFTGLYNNPCTINATSNCDIKGINLVLGYTSTVTQANSMTLGTDGFEINGGTFTGATQNITNAGYFKQTTGGTFTNTSGTHEVTALGSGVSTWDVIRGIHNHNSGTVKISGNLNAIVNNTSARQFYHLEINTSGVVSGISHVDGNLTRALGATLDADIAIKGDYLGSGVGGSSAGIGTIRFKGSAADQNFTYPYAPSVENNKSAFALVVPSDIQVGGSWTQTAGNITWNNKKVTFDNTNSASIVITTGNFYDVEIAKNPSYNVSLSGVSSISNSLTITSLANLNNNASIDIVVSNIDLSGNYILNSSTWGGTSKIIFKKGVNPSNTIVGLGKQGVSAEVNMPDGILELWDNFDIWNTGHDLVVRSGTFDLRGYNLTVNDTLTVFGTLTLTGGLPQIISVNGTTSLSTNANFTLSATSSTIVYTDSAVPATVTNLSNNFYNLIFGASKTHEFATGAPNLTTVNGRLSSNGTAGTRSILRSVGNASVDWKLTLNGTSTLADKVDVKRSDASGGLGVLAVGSVNSGNNTNWVGLIAVPYVTSVTSSSANGTYSSGVIPISIVFSEIVNVTGVPTVTLETGATDRVASYVSGTGTNTIIFNYTIQSGDASSDLDCLSNMALALSGGTIMNAGNTQNAVLDLFTPGATNSLGANKALVINTVVVAAPTVTGVSSSTANGSYKVGDIIAVQVTFSVLVNVTGTPTLTLETGITDRVVNYSSGSGSTILVFNYTVQSGDTSLDLDYTAISSLALNGGTIKNAGATNATLTLATPSFSNSLGSNKDIKIDTTVPTVSSVSASTADGNYNAGDPILITVVFSEAVTVTGAPTITLETGDTDRTATYVSGSGTTTLVFSYTVQSGDMAADLDYTATTALALASGAITDAALNAATLTLATPGAANSLGFNKAIIIDTTIPVVLSVSSSSADGIYKAGAVITITVTFSKVVNVAGVPTLTLETGTTDRTASYASGSNSTVLVFNYTVQSGDSSSDLDYVSTSSLSLASGSINDEFLNAATLTLAAPGSTNSLGGGKAIVIDTIAPTFASQTLDPGFTFIDITFSEPIYTASGASGGLASSDFSLIFAKNGGTATGVTISSVTTTSGGATAGGETTVRLNLSVSGVIAGVETFSIAPVSNSIFDMAGNAAPTSTSTGTLLIEDEVGPTITNVTSSTADGNYKAGDVISIQVVFSESVTVTGTPVLTLETGSTDQSVNYVSGSGSTTLTFTYTIQSGDASTDLEVQSTSALTLNGGTILDVASNAATLTLPTLGATGSLGLNKALVIDTTVPTILSAVLSPSNDFVTITFSEAVFTTAGTGAIAPSDFGIDFAANGGSATGVSITSILTTTGSALVGGETTIKIFIAVSGTVSGQETITVKALASSIFDLVGNALAAREISGTLTIEGGIDVEPPIGGSGGGCQYSANAGHENGVEWLLLLLVLFLPILTRKRKVR